MNTTDHDTIATIEANMFDREIITGNVKTTMKAIDAKSRDLWMVPVDALVVMDEFNVRPKNESYWMAVREYADSMKVNGFYAHKPFACIVMKENGEDKLAIFDGHTRFDALKLAIREGAIIERVPVVTASTGTSLEDITVGLITNNTGRQMEPMAIAVVCKRLVGYGLDNTEIAKRLSFTPAYVGSLLSLIAAPKRIRDMVTEGKVSATLAVSTLRDEGENAADVLEDGFVAAKAAGKDKVTKKNLVTKAVAKPKTPSVLEKGLEWIEKNGRLDSCYAMLAHITGKTKEELQDM